LDALPRGIIEWLRTSARFSTPDGEIQCLGEEGVKGLPDLSDATIRWLSAEQSNSSLIIGNVAMIKLIRRVSPGVHPEAEMTRRLTTCGYANSPQLLGEVVRIGRNGVPHTLAIIQSAIANQGDAWTWTIDNLRRALEDATIGDGAGEDSAHAFKALADFADVVGKRLGELHVALAADTNDSAFTPAAADDEAGRRNSGR
jgi:maltose alpha-D-glucosyltransferase / alpha-amylase